MSKKSHLAVIEDEVEDCRARISELERSLRHVLGIVSDHTLHPLAQLELIESVAQGELADTHH